jgi:hypothetical protein
MRLKEPITCLTDVILALCGLSFAGILFLKWNQASNEAQGLHALCFAAFFLIAAFSAIVGSFEQGMFLTPETEQRVAKVKVALLALSLYPFMLELLHLYGSQVWVLRYGLEAFIPFGVFLLLVFVLNYRFIGFIVFSSAFFVIAYVVLIAAYLRGAPVGLLLIGITVCCIASALQATRRTLPFLSHNDLYHIVGIAAWIVIFFGALAL